MAIKTAELAGPRPDEIRDLPPAPRITTVTRVAAAAVAGPRPDGEDRLRLIAEAAYFRAEQRDFAPGQELEDWLAAEIEVDALFGKDYLD